MGVPRWGTSNTTANLLQISLSEKAQEPWGTALCLLSATFHTTAVTKSRQCPQGTKNQFMEWNQIKTSSFLTRSRIFYHLLAKHNPRKTTCRKKTMGRFLTTSTKLKTVFNKNTKCFKPCISNNKKTSNHASIKAASFQGIGRRNSRRTQTKMERNQQIVPKVNPCQACRYCWTQTQEGRIRTAAQRNLGRYQKTQQSLHLCGMILYSQSI